MEGLRCGSYNYLILFNLQRREYCQKVYPLIHLLTPISRTNETIPLKFPADSGTAIANAGWLRRLIKSLGFRALGHDICG